MDDPENIVELIRKDRMKGAIRLVAEYKDRVVHAAYSLCRDRELAEDLAMCTFESVIDKIGTCRNHEAFFSWMYSIMLNHYRKTVRGAMRKSTILAGSRDDLEAYATPPGANDDPVAVAVDCGIVREAVDALPPKQREAIILRYFMDMPLLKMAKVLSVPLGTVQSRLDMARKVLAARLAKQAKKPLVAMLAALVVVAVSAAVAISVVRGTPGGPTSPSAAKAAGGSRPTGGPMSPSAAKATAGLQFIATATGGSRLSLPTGGPMSSSAATVATIATLSAAAVETNQSSTANHQGENEMNLKTAAAPVIAAAVAAAAPVMSQSASSADKSIALVARDRTHSELPLNAFLSRDRSSGERHLATFRSDSVKGFAMYVK